MARQAGFILVNARGNSALLQADRPQTAMAVFTATLSRFPVAPGTTLVIDGVPEAGDMLRVAHGNGTHSAVRVESCSADWLVVAMLAQQIEFRPATDSDFTQGTGTAWVTP